jgi:hypothetical protein
LEGDAEGNEVASGRVEFGHIREEHAGEVGQDCLLVLACSNERVSAPIDRSGAEGRTAHDNHADESGEEAGDLIESLYDLELVREVDQGGQGVVRDELSGGTGPWSV